MRARVYGFVHDRRFLAFLLCVGLEETVRYLARSPFVPLSRQLLDLRVFYCGGRVFDGGANPYLLDPIRECEHAYPDYVLAHSPNLALPFVLPPFDLPPLALLARLPFETAAAVFLASQVVALVVAIVLVSRTLRIPIVVAAAALTFCVGFPSFILGQVVPFELAAVALTAYALVTGRDRLAGLAAVAAFIEPHLGAFVALAVALGAPRARLALAAGVTVLGVVAILCSGPSFLIEYLTRILPAHAAAEAPSQEQYSLAGLLALLGIPASRAVALGSASSVVMLAASALIALAAVPRLGRAALVFIPAAFAVTGGTFVHLTQIGVAVPAALLLVQDRDVKVRTPAVIALLALVIPWLYPVSTKFLLAFALTTWAVIIWWLTRGSLRVSAGALFAFWFALATLENNASFPGPLPVVPYFPSTTPVWIEWGRAMAQLTGHDPWHTFVRVATWFGLTTLMVTTLLALEGRVREFSAAPNASPQTE